MDAGAIFYRLMSGVGQMNGEPWVIEKLDGIELRCLLQPRAGKSQFVGIHGDEIKIRIQAPPIDGRANEELGQFLAKSLDVPKRAVEIVSGVSSRHKRVLIRGKTLSELQHLLTSLLEKHSP